MDLKQFLPKIVRRRNTAYNVEKDRFHFLKLFFKNNWMIKRQSQLSFQNENENICTSIKVTLWLSSAKGLLLSKLMWNVSFQALTAGLSFISNRIKQVSTSKFELVLNRKQKWHFFRIQRYFSKEHSLVTTENTRLHKGI